MNSRGEARDSNRDQKPFVSLYVQACSEESPSVFPSCANALTVWLHSSYKPSQLHMATIRTVTALKYWRAFSPWPYCKWGRVFVFCWWWRHVTVNTRCSSLARERSPRRRRRVYTLQWGQDCFPPEEWWRLLCVCVQTGGMPAPEQSPVTEEGLLLTIRDGSTGRNMEAENTANNILASVKEQVACPDPWNPSNDIPALNLLAARILILIYTWNYTLIYFSCDKYSKSTPNVWPFF